MTPKEKQISFYNNYFIYKKVRNVDARSVYNTMVGSSKFQEQMNKTEEDEADEDAGEIEKQVSHVKAPKKLKRRLILAQSSKESVESVESNNDKKQVAKKVITKTSKKIK